MYMYIYTWGLHKLKNSFAKGTRKKKGRKEKHVLYNIHGTKLAHAYTTYQDLQGI